MAMLARRTKHDEMRRACGRQQKDAVVAKALLTDIEAERSAMQRKAAEMAVHMREKKEAKRSKEETKATKAALAQAKKALRDSKHVLETWKALKSFSPEMLGEGKKNGGSKEIQKRRFEVLHRVALHGAAMTARQYNDWGWFVEAWDTAMSEEHDKEWGSLFAAMVQHLLDELKAGKRCLLYTSPSPRDRG